MQRILNAFMSTCRLVLTGAWPVDTLNRISAAGIAFWNVTTCNEQVSMYIYRRDLGRVRELCERDGMLVQTKIFGMPHRFRGLRKRYLLLILLPLLIFVTIFLQNFIWYLQVEGNQTLTDEQILQALQSIGIYQGAYVRTIDGQMVKNHMLRFLPELEWISVNKQGGRATVLVKERRNTPYVSDPHLVSNIVASRAGVISEMQVYSGFAVTQVGSSVLQGELLVSGLGSSWNAVVCRNAEADVFAYTRHETRVVLPEQAEIAVYNGEETTSWSLIFGKKRWNFFSNSGIALTGYDKIERVYQWKLPGGITFPVYLVKTVCRDYELQSISVQEKDAEMLLSEASQRIVASQMTAGVVLDRQEKLTLRDGLWCLDTVSAANEMIAATVQINPWSDEEYE